MKKIPIQNITFVEQLILEINKNYLNKYFIYVCLNMSMIHIRFFFHILIK